MRAHRAILRDTASSAHECVARTQLEDTEDKIAYARQFYNATVLEYNNKIQTFPSNILANLFSFKEEEFFEVKEGERERVEVKF